MITSNAPYQFRFPNCFTPVEKPSNSVDNPIVILDTQADEIEDVEEFVLSPKRSKVLEADQAAPSASTPRWRSRATNSGESALCIVMQRLTLCLAKPEADEIFLSMRGLSTRLKRHSLQRCPLAWWSLRGLRCHQPEGVAQAEEVQAILDLARGRMIARAEAEVEKCKRKLEDAEAAFKRARRKLRHLK